MGSGTTNVIFASSSLGKTADGLDIGGLGYENVGALVNSQSSANNPAILAHEMGHYFGYDTKAARHYSGSDINNAMIDTVHKGVPYEIDPEYYMKLRAHAVPIKPKG